MSKRPWVFRLYPEEGRTLFVRAIVHESHNAMREHWLSDPDPCEFNGGGWDKRRGYCREITRWVSNGNGRLRRDPCVAEVHLFHPWCTMGVVSHEFFHATMAWARRTGFEFSDLGPDADPVNDEEEFLAYIHGDLCRDFVVRGLDEGIYKEGPS